MKTIQNFFSAFKGHGLFASLITLIVFPFVLLYTVISSIMFPIITLIMVTLMFVYMVVSAICPVLFEDLAYFADISIKRLAEIPSFERHFSHKKEDKMWIRSLNLKKDSKPIKGDRTSNEFRRFASIILWLFACKELRPYFIQFLARVERLIQSNGST